MSYPCTIAAPLSDVLPTSSEYLNTVVALIDYIYVASTIDLGVLSRSKLPSFATATAPLVLVNTSAVEFLYSIVILIYYIHIAIAVYS